MRRVDTSNQIIIGTITDYASLFFFYVADYYTIRYHYLNNDYVDTLAASNHDDSWHSLFPGERVVCK